MPIGGHYTMDRHDAVVAAELIGAGTVIPCHYNTFPPIERTHRRRASVENQTNSKVVVLEPDESYNTSAPAKASGARPVAWPRRR